jgi:hypothetical protein
MNTSSRKATPQQHERARRPEPIGCRLPRTDDYAARRRVAREPAIHAGQGEPMNTSTARITAADRTATASRRGNRRLALGIGRGGPINISAARTSAADRAATASRRGGEPMNTFTARAIAADRAAGVPRRGLGKPATCPGRGRLRNTLAARTWAANRSTAAAGCATRVAAVRTQRCEPISAPTTQSLRPIGQPLWAVLRPTEVNQ